MQRWLGVSSVRWETVPSEVASVTKVHAVKLVADVAPRVAGLGLGDAQQEQRQPAEHPRQKEFLASTGINPYAH
jgi:hypothetical protein